MVCYVGVKKCFKCLLASGNYLFENIFETKSLNVNDVKKVGFQLLISRRQNKPLKNCRSVMAQMAKQKTQD